MDLFFLFRCFFIGILAASGCGPIFVLTFNRSAVCGFWKGLATGLGASLADSLYFLLGLLGALAVIGELKYFMIVLDLIGGLLLLGLGWHSLKKMKQVVCVTVECSDGSFLAMTMAFTITLFNPLVILFFMAITIQALPDNVGKFSWYLVSLSTFCVLLGSLSVLGTVSLIASFLGSCISARKLRLISGVTGILFIIFGLYLLGDFVLQLVS
jgi:threonine/homoserine/homoserine lactone efflux protein